MWWVETEEVERGNAIAILGFPHEVTQIETDCSRTNQNEMKRTSRGDMKILPRFGGHSHMRDNDISAWPSGVPTRQL